MELLLKREPSEEDHTFGQLFVDGIYQCETLEDVIREVPGVPVTSWKIAGETAIPAGRYGVSIDYSPHFECEMPIIEDVPGFIGVRIHPGNTAKDTEGCILVGRMRLVDALGESRLAFDAFFDRLKTAISNGEDVVLTVINP